MTIIFYELPVEIGKAKEGLKMLQAGGNWPGGH